MTMMRSDRSYRVARLATFTAVSLVIFGCAGDDEPIRLSLDGSLVTGDALPADAEPDAETAPDAGPSDDQDAATAGDATADDASNPADATATDAGTADAGTTDAGPPALCSAPSEATVAAIDVPSMAARLDGQIITIVGTATAGVATCTTRPCPPDNPCCNACSAAVFVSSVTLVESACFERPTCVGNECILACQPPAPPIRGTARYRGVLRADPPPPPRTDRGRLSAPRVGRDPAPEIYSLIRRPRREACPARSPRTAPTRRSPRFRTPARGRPPPKAR